MWSSVCVDYIYKQFCSNQKKIQALIYQQMYHNKFTLDSMAITYLKCPRLVASRSSQHYYLWTIWSDKSFLA